MTVDRNVRQQALFQGCLAGLACGDAIGSMADPNAATPGRHARYAMLIARSLASCEGLHRGDLDERLAEEYRHASHTLSKSSRAAAVRYICARDGRLKSLEFFEPHLGYADCEVAARIAPLGLWSATRSHRMDDLVRHAGTIAQQTHRDRSASFGGIAMAAAVRHVLARGHDTSNDAAHFRAAVLATVRHAEEQLLEGRPAYSAHLERAFRMAELGKTLHDVGAFTASHAAMRVDASGKTDLAFTAVPFALATFLRHPKSFRNAIREAVDAGGDTAAHGAMVGALIGANVGYAGIPMDLYHDEQTMYEAYRVANALHDMCVRTDASRR